MSVADWALVISICSAAISLAGLAWNILVKIHLPKTYRAGLVRNKQDGSRSRPDWTDSQLVGHQPRTDQSHPPLRGSENAWQVKKHTFSLYEYAKAVLELKPEDTQILGDEHAPYGCAQRPSRLKRRNRHVPQT